MRGQIKDVKGVLIGKKVNTGSKMSKIMLKMKKKKQY